MSELSSSALQSLRLNAKVRSAIIGYGIAAYGFLLYSMGARPADETGSPLTSLLRMVVMGLALQGLLLLVRWLVTRYERRNRLEGELMPIAYYIFELFADAATVLLFAVATFRGIFSTAANL